jgi:oligoribonuclease
MTGLDFQNDYLLEIACICTYKDSLEQEIFRYHAIFHVDDSKLSRMQPLCYDMHTQSGLLEKVNSSTVMYGEADAALSFLVSTHCMPLDTLYIAGNSVYNDLIFIKRFLPLFANRLHYRTFDISTLKIWAEIQGMPAFVKQKKHEAMADIHESIAEYCYYKKMYDVITL